MRAAPDEAKGRQAHSLTTLPVLLLALSAPAFAAPIAGRVQLEDNGRRVPAPKVLVVAASMDSGETLAATRTAPDGSYVLAGPIQGRIALRVERRGWIGLAAGEATGDSVQLDCSVPCGPVDFVLIRGGVLTGVVVDDLGEPLPGSQVRLVSPREFGPSAVQANDRTDDRGVFRIAGIQPGSYAVRVETPFRSAADVRWQGPEVPVDVEAGQETSLRLTLDRIQPRVFRVAGTVSGVEMPEDATSVVIAFSADVMGGFRNRSNASRLGPGGAFEFDALPAGEYEFRFSVRGRGRMPGDTPLGAVRVESDIEGLRLSPVPTVSVAGRIVVEGQWRGRPPAVSLRSRPASRPGPMLMPRDSEGRFEISAVAPGRYSLSLRSREGFVREVRVGDRVIDPSEVDISADIDDLTVVVSAEYAVVSGRIKQSDGEAARHYVVGLSGEGRVRTVQTDQFGRFEFARVPPGDYRIGAWTGKSEGDIRLSETWDDAGNAVRFFPVRAADRIELDLTAVPE